AGALRSAAEGMNPNPGSSCGFGNARPRNLRPAHSGENIMKTTTSLFALVAMALVSTSAMAQSGGGDTPTEAQATDTVEKAPSLKSVLTTQKKIEVQNYRPVDQRGINMFEPPKDDGTVYKGFALMWGASFT